MKWRPPGQDGLGSESEGITSFARGRGLVGSCSLFMKAGWGEIVSSSSGWVGVKWRPPGQDGLGSESQAIAGSRGDWCPPGEDVLG